MKVLSKQQILMLHSMLVAQSGGMDGLRDEGLHQALMRLPEKIRLTMVLFYLDGFSQREICGILRVPAGTVKSRLNQGRKQLKKQLESEV